MKFDRTKLKFKRILHLVLAAQALPLLCGLLMVIALEGVIVLTERSTRNEEQARMALRACSSAQKHMMKGVFSLVMYDASGLPSDLDDYRNARPELQLVVKQLEELAKRYPSERQLTEEMSKLAVSFGEMGDQIVVIHQLGRGFANFRADEIYQECQYMVDHWGKLSQMLEKAITAELEHSPVSSQSYLTTLSRILLIGLLAEFIACIVNARLLTGYIDRRLSVVKANSEKLAHRQPLLPRLDGSDEIATLDKEFHSMAAAIVEATRRETEILENASDIILTADQALVIQSANQASVRLWGRDKELTGASLLALAGKEDGTRLQQFFLTCRHSGQPATIELPLLSAEQQPLYASLSAQWSEDNRLFSLVVHDISERKKAEDALREAEQRLRTMMERMPAGMLLVNPAGTIVTANQSAVRLLTGSGQVLDRLPLTEVLPLNGRSASEWLEASQQGKQVIVPLDQKAAGTTHLEITVERVTIGSATSYLLVLMDISANQKLDLLRHNLIDGISETIITPLSSISDVLSHLDAIAKEENNDRGLKYISAARSESDRVLSLFSDLLEIESSNVRQLSIQPKEVTVSQLFERSLEAVRVTAEKKGISLSSKPIAATIHVDPDRVVQVLVNLIFNALKFTPSGGSVTLESEQLGDGQVELRVADSGCGIPAGKESQIFEPFKQTKASDSLAKGGSGLGLFICKSLVEKHGGTIAARNQPNGGAVFVIRLPKAPSGAVFRMGDAIHHPTI